jgi:hypothetical protein
VHCVGRTAHASEIAETVCCYSHHRVPAFVTGSTPHVDGGGAAAWNGDVEECMPSMRWRIELLAAVRGFHGELMRVTERRIQNWPRSVAWMN